MGYTSFDTWTDLLTYARMGETLFYHAPLDHKPAPIRYWVRGDRVRVVPYGGWADPFYADAGHLSRFRREARS